MVAKRQVIHAAGSVSPLSDGKPIPCVVMRGGTSRGLFFHEHDLPREPGLRDSVMMGAVGAPDPRQVDGLGGADMLSSKIGIVCQSVDDSADVECEFANIAPGKSRPTFGTNCGNLVAAVALFAIDEGIVSPRCKHAGIRIKNRNSGDVIEARVGSLARASDDDAGWAGMSNSGVCVDLDFIDPVGTVRNTMLPTGSPRETYVLGDGRSVDVSVVDAGALYVFARASDFDLTATESAAQLQSNPAALVALEHLRSMVAHNIGIVDSASDAISHSPDVPKLAFVGPPQNYDFNDHSGSITSDKIDLVSRIVSSQNYHCAYAVTGAIATAVAAAVPGSVVNEAIGRDLHSGVHGVRIGHPSGVMTCAIESRQLDGRLLIPRAGIMRTARRIMQGNVIVPNSCF